MHTEYTMSLDEYGRPPANDGQKCQRAEIRSPRATDIGGIVELVQSCRPFLTAHESYIYWMNLRCFRETCAIAELNGKVVGWCSMVPVTNGKYFIHQTGVAPDLRGKGLGTLMLLFVLNTAKDRAVQFEFTIDRRNTACLYLMKSVAARTGMRLAKRPEPVELLEENCGDELYVMTPSSEISRDLRA